MTAATASILPSGAITIPGSLTISSGLGTLSNLTVSGTLTLSTGVAITVNALTGRRHADRAGQLDHRKRGKRHL